VTRKAAFEATAAAILAFAGCNTVTSNGEPCYPGDYVYCACDDGVQGYSRCATGAGASGYGPCDCSGVAPGLLTDAAIITCQEDDAGKQPILCPCAGNGECETGVCYDFPSKGSFCTKPCKSGADCPVASGGCTPKGFCMVP
jgi:hypothetical protein